MAPDELQDAAHLPVIDIARRPNMAGLMRTKDICVLAKLPLAASTAWQLPEPWWDRVGEIEVRLVRALAPGRFLRDQRHLEQFIGNGDLGLPMKTIQLG